MHAFIVLGLVISIRSQEIGLGKRLRNDLICLDRVGRKTTTQSVNNDAVRVV